MAVAAATLARAATSASFAQWGQAGMISWPGQTALPVRVVTRAQEPMADFSGLGRVGISAGEVEFEASACPTRAPAGARVEITGGAVWVTEEAALHRDPDALVWTARARREPA